MPRQLDLTPGNLKVNNNPNVQLAVTGNQINSLFTEFNNLAELTFEAIVALIDQLFDYIDQATGLNLKALADLFAQLDFSSPSAFIASLVPFLTQLPEVLVELLISLIEQLIDPANSTLLQNLMEAAIQLLMSLPQLIEALFAPLLNMFMSFLSGGLLTTGGLSDVSSMLGNIPLIGPFLEELTGSATTGGGGQDAFNGFFGDLTGLLGDPTGLATGSAGLGDLNNIPILGPIIGAFTGSFLGAGSNGSSGTGGTITDLLQSITSIPAEMLTGTIGAGLISHAGVGTISNQTPELLTNPNFDTATSLLGQGMWIWDGTQGPAGVSTSVYTNANGTLRELNSNSIAVAAGQSLAGSGNTKWSGFTGAANSIALTIAKFDSNNTLLGYDTIASIASPAGSSSWVQLSATYTVPSGVTSVQLRPVVTAAATAGQVWFGKLSVKQTGTTLSNPLIGLLDASKIGSGAFPLNMTGVQSLMDTMFQTLSGSTATGTGFPDIANILGLIPFGNVIGIGGPSDVGSSIQSTWDQLISGLVGSVGTGAGLSDLFNIGNQVSSKASKGAAGWDILGIRNNKSLKTGFLPSSQSNISLDKLALTATMPTVPVTQSTALCDYERIGESIDIGAVSWQGAGTTNITAAFVNLYKMNPTTGVNALVHQSANIVGTLSATMAPVVYSLPAAPVHFDPAEILGVEVTVQGTGTHNMAGSVSALPDQTVYPRRWSSVRDAGTTGPPSSFTPVYGSNVAFVEYAVTAGTLAVPHSPTPILFNIPGTVSQVIPDWANYVDRIAVGSGGGGGGGTGIGPGSGGGAGSWAVGTWARGADFTGTPSISVTVPAGGAKGGSGLSSPGAAATATLSGSTMTAAGGISGDTRNAGATGASPGNQVYLGQTYVGGGTQGAGDGVGASPGGGGGGGSAPVGPGGNGGPGAVWIVFRQT